MDRIVSSPLCAREKPMQRLRASIVQGVSLLFLMACGSGGGGGPESTPPPPPPPPAQIPSGPGWYQIPDTKIDSVCAATNGFPQISGNTGCSAIFAWSGGAFDSKRNRLIAWGGGHTDYYGNELYSLNLSDLSVRRLNDPGLPIATSCTDAIAGGTQPNSRHTYDGVEYMENVDRLYVYSGALACNNGDALSDTWTFDFATMKWQKMNPTGPVPLANVGMLTAYDPNSGRVFLHDQQHLYAYNFATNAYTRVSSSATSLGYEMSATIDPDRRLFVIVGFDNNVNAGRVYTYDISGTNAALTTVSTSGAPNIVSSANPGLAYDPVSQRIVAWNGGDSVYSLNLGTRVWTATTLSGGPGAVSSTGHGTFGRWRYSPSTGVFVLLNATGQNGFTFRLP
jgi:hypothetical protein